MAMQELEGVVEFRYSKPSVDIYAKNQFIMTLEFPICSKSAAKSLANQPKVQYMSLNWGNLKPKLHGGL